MALLLSACSLVPDYETPSVAVPDVWHNTNGVAVGSEAALTPAWWQNFNSPYLNSLIEKALAGNNDVLGALARVKQARASAKIAGGSLYPSLDASAGVSHSDNRPGTGPSSSGESWNAGASLSYELDIFGRNRNAVESAELHTQASEFDRQAVALTTAGDVAQDYAGLLSLNERLAIAENNLKNARDVLAIIQARFSAGAVSALELAQQKASVATSEASIADLKKQQESLRSQIAILTGEPPQTFALASGPALAPMALPPALVFTPRSVLDHRPDVQRAEAGLKASNVDIGTARAAFFPRLSLGLDTALSANPLSAPVSLASSIASSLTAPLFHGGELEGGVELAQARKEESATVYRQAVLTAFGEVDETLSALTTAKLRTAAFELAAAESRKAYVLARQRYQAGATDFQEFLNAQRDVLNAEDTLAQVKLLQITAMVDLYKALGGGMNNAAK